MRSAKVTGAIDEEGGNFIRLRVTVDISLPLCRGRVITMENEGNNLVSFRYKRLHNLCYWCGRLNHNDKN